MTLSLDAAIRTLLLPIRPATGEEHTKRAEQILLELGVSGDLADWVNLESVAWERAGTPSAPFRTFVERLLYSPGKQPASFALDIGAIGDDAQAEATLRAFSSRYFKLHARVMADDNVDHQQAKRILSHTHTIVLLATGARMTASHIYSMLLKDGIALGKSWSTPRLILDQCGLKQDVSVADVKALYIEDAEAEPELLGDLDLTGGIEYVADMCSRFGYANDLRRQLTTLLSDDLHPPYLCMMHFQLVTLAIYNHRLTNAYEFKPRGAGVLWLSDE